MVGQACFDDLPPEMLEEIMKKLDVSSLLSCRLVNRKCNEWSRELLNSPAWIKVVPVGQKSENNIVVKHNQDLYKFVECFEKSKNFPFSHYRFELIYNLVDLKFLKNFISSCNISIKGLDLRLFDIPALRHLDPSIEYVKDLLVKLPNLEEFGLRLDLNNGLYYNYSSLYSFFSRTRTQIRVKSFQLPKLPKLKVIRLCPSLLDDIFGFAEDLLEAATNLKQIEIFFIDNENRVFTVRQFQFLYFFGKLDLLQTAEISPSFELVSWTKNELEQGNPVLFKLTKLTLHTSVLLNQGFFFRAAAFINQLLDSVKDTLKELEVDDIFVLDTLQFPKFTKLTKFSKISRKTVTICLNTITFLNVERFPVLNELDLSAEDVKFCLPPQGLISILPSIKTVKVSQVHVNAEFIKGLAKMCPNLTQLIITGVIKNFTSFGSSVWIHMQKLESLDLVIFGDSQENSTASIVSVFTGISKGNSQVLLDNFKASAKPMPKSKKLTAKKSLKMSESEMKEMRANVSILDLKELRKLDMGLDNLELLYLDKKSCIEVIKIHACDYMPHLDVSTRIC